MKDLKQILTIKKALTQKKEMFAFELAKIISIMDKKIATINRMQSYQSEYELSEKFKVTRANPGLSKNLYAFQKKINDVIIQAETEVDKLAKSKATIMSKVSEISAQIKVMNIFEEKVKHQMLLRSEKLEQSMMDDLVSTRYSGDDHG